MTKTPHENRKDDCKCRERENDVNVFGCVYKGEALCVCVCGCAKIASVCV